MVHPVNECEFKKLLFYFELAHGPIYNHFFIFSRAIFCRHIHLAEDPF